MGNESSAAAPGPAASLTTNTSNAATTPATLSTTPITTVASITTAAPTNTVATETTTTAIATTTPTTTITTAATETTPTPAITWTALAAKAKDTTNTAAATVTTPTPATNWTGLVAKAKDASTTPASTESTSQPTFYSLVKSLTSDADKVKSASSAYAHWYKFSKFEQQKRDKGKILWYMSPPVTTTALLSPATSTLTMTTARTPDDPKEVSNLSNITAIPSYQLRSTAVYSPPHGDRVPSGRSELINTDVSVFKYYLPENRSKQTAGIHTKATMYKMNTQSRQTPLPTHLSPSTVINANVNTNITENNAPLPTFVSRGLQTDLVPQSMGSTSAPMHYYEKQKPQIVPISAFSDHTSNGSGFYHLPSQDKTSQPVLPPIEKTPVWFNDQPRLSATQSSPSYPRPPPQPRPPILKNSSTVLSQDVSNPLSGQTHDKVLEELRKRNKNTKDGMYRVKKVHLLEKNDPEYRSPAAVSFHLPPPRRPSKATQSISRSEKLFFSQLFNRKK